LRIGTTLSSVFHAAKNPNVSRAQSSTANRESSIKQRNTDAIGNRKSPAAY
jgi:hypothetical protein